MAELTGMVGFASPIAENRLSRRRNVCVELIATAVLAVSLVIAATVVSIGMARAQALGAQMTRVSGSNGMAAHRPRAVVFGLGSGHR
jgi:methenyltetrahydromethanopterin cyclohydrolase